MIFDHLQKTAGMAVNRWLRKSLGDDCASPNLICDHRSLIARYGGRYSVLSAHVAFDGRGLDPRYQYVTILREPIDRMVSQLHYIVGNHSEAQVGSEWHDIRRFVESEGTVGDYEPAVNFYVEHFNGIDRQVCDSDEQRLAAALSAVEGYDVWGLYESMPEFLEDFAALLGVPAPTSIDRVNVTNRRPTMDQLGATLRRRLEKVCALDIEFYSIMKGRHAESRRQWRGTSVSSPGWEPLHPQPPRTIARDGFTLRSAAIQGGEARTAGELLEFDVVFSLERPIADLVILAVITDSLGNRVFVADTELLGRPIGLAAAGTHRACCTIVAHLSAGEYSVGFRFREKTHGVTREIGTYDGLCVFRIGKSDGAAMADLPTAIRCIPLDASSLAAGWRLGAGDVNLHSAVGRFEGGSVVTDGRAGHLLFGPYKSVIAGRWMAIVEGLFEPGAGCVRIDVASRAGQVVHAKCELTDRAERVGLDFRLAHPVHDLEIRVWVHEFASARIDAIAVESGVSSASGHGGDDDGFPEGRDETVREASAQADPEKAAAPTRGAARLAGGERADGGVARGAPPLGNPAGGAEVERLVGALVGGSVEAARGQDSGGGGTRGSRSHDARDADRTGPGGLEAGRRLTRRPPATFSIVVATDGRASALAELLDSLSFLEGPPLEVCVVRGPTEDGIDRVLDVWRGRIKIAFNPCRNLSISRNLGIAMAAGDVVAFLDDDAIPEDGWLSDLADAFADPAVACAGGVNRDRSGEGLQYGHATADRMGRARWDRAEPADLLCRPGAAEFPYVQGTNAAVRHDDLQAVGGFDEEFDFYLDETDLCCRLVDEGRLVRQLPRAFVHHRSLPSEIRSPEGVTHSLYSVLKNKLYFSLVNSRGHHSTDEALADFEAFVAIQERRLRRMAADSDDGEAWLDRFAIDVQRARAAGLVRGRSGLRRLMSPGLVALHRRPFLPLVRNPAAERRSCAIHRRGGAAAIIPVRPTGDAVGEQRSLLRRTWAELLPPGTQVALALRPDHRNVGDAAIWWGTRSLLESLGVGVRYECGASSYTPESLARAHPDGPILLLGGGNLGDVYGEEQGLRSRILQDFADRPIIQLPQSVWFRSGDARDAMASMLARCRDVTLMLRDSQSLAFARTHFNVPSLACPDAAMALDLSDVPHAADVPVVALWRHDIEFDRPLPPLPAGSIEIDWQDESRRTARERTLLGCRLLSRGRVVITNRLHAHLLCVLLRIPHVVCDTVNGKIFAYRDSWPVEERLVRYAATAEEAVDLAWLLAKEAEAAGSRAA